MTTLLCRNAVQLAQLFVSIPPLEPWGPPNVGWDGWVCSCFSTSVHAVIHTMLCYPPLQQLHSDFGDFSGGVCCVVMEVTMVESHPDTGLWGFQWWSLSSCHDDDYGWQSSWHGTFNLRNSLLCFCPDIVTRANKMPVMTVSVASDLTVDLTLSRLLSF